MTLKPQLFRWVVQKSQIITSCCVKNSKQYASAPAALSIQKYLQENKRNEAMEDAKFSQLIRALFVLKLSTWEIFIKNSDKFYQFGCKFAGKTLTNAALRGTFFKQFVAGENDVSLEGASRNLLKYGNVKLMICPPMEDLEGECDNFAPRAIANKDRLIEYMEMGDKFNKTQPGQACLIQYKLTCVFPVQAQDHVSEHDSKCKRPLGETVMLYKNAMNSGQINSSSLSPYQKQAESIKLGLQLSAEIFQKAADLNIPILVDAELKSSYYFLHAMTLAAAALHNKKSIPNTMIYGTYQCYFRDIQTYVDQSLEICQDHNVRFGAKFVRGAYLNLERKIAAASGLPSPTWDTYEETSVNYNRMVEFLLNHKKDSPDSCGIFIASHNLDSIEKALKTMDNLGLSKNDPNINFGQIYGMCDPISFGLGNNGYNVFKSTPWGKPEELIGYLGRRAAENYTAFQTARNELPTYKEEIKRRILMRQR